jgi:asparagine synthase (glutamine-hydrolysing)
MTGLAAFFSRSEIAAAKLEQAVKALQPRRGGDGAGFRWLASHDGDRLAATAGPFAHAGVAQISSRAENGELISRLGGQDITLVFDGALYNRDQLAAELGLASPLRPADDAALLALGYRAWGNGVFPRINGVWAAIILDLPRRVAVVSRDRFGSRPLYHARTQDALWLASDIVPLIAAGAIRFAPDQQTVSNFFRSGEIDVGRDTFFEGVKSVPPAAVVEIDIARPGSSLRQTPYYSLPAEQLDLPFPAYAEKFRECFFDAVSLRLNGGVPTGACLSGGIDSSSIVSALAAISDRQPQASDTSLAFGYCLDGSDMGERRFIEIAARGARRTLVPVVATQEQFAAAVQTILGRFDEPVGSASIAAQSMVYSAAAGRGVGAVLDGQAADQFLAGYHGNFAPHYMNLIRQRAYLSAWRLRFAHERRIGPFPLLSVSRLPFNPFWRAGAPRPDPAASRMTAIYFAAATPAFRETCAPRSEQYGGTDLRGMLSAQIRSTNLPQLMRYADRNSAAIGIETRMPFLDHRLVELAMRVPERYLFDGALTKFILRSAMRAFMPPEIYNRVSKIGFRADPDGTARFAQDMGDAFLENGTAFEKEWFDPDGVRAFLASEQAPFFDFLLWRILNLKTWARRLASAY